MLRITQQDNAKAAKQYYSSADYLSEGQEIVGSWGGEGARRLGLELFLRRAVGSTAPPRSASSL